MALDTWGNMFLIQNYNFAWFNYRFHDTVGYTMSKVSEQSMTKKANSQGTDILLQECLGQQM